MGKIKIKRRTPDVAFAGSLVQQNHGEDLIHGILKWDVQKRISTFAKIENPIGYATIEIENDKVITPRSYINKLPKNLRLRIKYSNSSYNTVRTIIDTLKTKHHILEKALIRVNDFENRENNSKTVLGDVRDIEYQNQLITTYFENIDTQQVFDTDGVRHVNRVMNSKLPKQGALVRNVIWKPKSFKFSNMFSYGPGNSIDFSNYTGVQGLFAPNASGKSTLLDALQYCMFDKCSKTYKAKDVINIEKNRFNSKFTFELNGDDYVIEREGIRNKKTGNVKVNVKFGIQKGDEYTSLNGNDRDGTNRIIRDYIGTFDDFLLTAMSTQHNNKNFVFRSQRERKDLLNSFLDISIFEDLYLLTRSEIRDQKSSIRILERDLDAINVTDLETELGGIVQEYLNIQDTIITLDAEANETNAKINTIYEQIQHVDAVIDIDDLNDKERKIEDKINNVIVPSISKVKGDIVATEELIKAHPNDNTFNLLDGSIIMAEEKTINDAYHNNQLLMQSVDKDIQSSQRQIDHLLDHKFDPECDYCIKNSWVIHSKEAEVRMPSLITEKASLTKECDKILKSKEKIAKKLAEYNECKLINDKLLSNSKRLLELELNLKHIIDQESKMKNMLDGINKLKAQYHKQKTTQIQNEKLVIEKDNLTVKFNELQRKLKESYSKSMALHGSKITIESTLSSWKQKQKQSQKLIDELHLYELYLKAISKYGVPQMLIKKILPVIEEEVNLILNQLVNFYISLEVEEKNINCYIHYDESKSWPVENGSGMEKFMISIAFRSALINVSSLPRPNFLAIDEGFSVADSENLSSLPSLFEYLTHQFDFIIIISHLSTMRDLATNRIEIDKHNGFSLINAL